MALKSTPPDFNSKFGLVFTTRHFLILKWGKTTRISVYPVLGAEFLQKPGVDFSQFCLIPGKFLRQIHHNQELFSPKEPKKISGLPKPKSCLRKCRCQANIGNFEPPPVMEFRLPNSGLFVAINNLSWYLLILSASSFRQA